VLAIQHNSATHATKAKNTQQAQ